MADLCPKCGGNLALIGRAHRCIPKVPSVTHVPVVEVTHADGSSATRVARWRKAHPEEHAAQQRAYRARRKQRV